MKRLFAVFFTAVLVLAFSSFAFSATYNIVSQANFYELVSSENSTYLTFNFKKGQENLVLVDYKDLTGVLYIDKAGEKFDFTINDSATTMMVLGGSATAMTFSSDLSIGKDGGNITAVGGSVLPNSHGIKVEKNLVQRNGILKALGGSSTESYGIDALKVVQRGGTMMLEGSTAEKSYGISTESLEQYGGSIIATGGSGDDSYGLNVVSIILQDSGYIEAIGGTGINSHGINLIASSTSEQIKQNEDGYIKAVGNVGFGLYSGYNIEIRGTLESASIGSAFSVYSDNIIFFMAKSVLTPVIDLSKSSDSSTGLIAAGHSIIINNDVSLLPKFINTYMFKEDLEMIFIKQGINADGTDSGINSAITGSFIPVSDTITLKVDATLENSNKEYKLSVERKMTPKEALEGNVNQKYVDIVDVIYSLLSPDEGIIETSPYHFLVQFLDKIESSITVKDALSVINSSSIESLSLYNTVAIRNFKYNNIALNSKLANFSGKTNITWIDATYNYSSDGDETIDSSAGIALGYGISLKNISLAAQIHGNVGEVIPSSEIQEYYDAIFSIGATIIAEYGMDISKFLNPRGSITIGYSYGDVIYGFITQNVFNAALNISDKMLISDKITITPTIGLNFNYCIFDEYENDDFSIPVTRFPALLFEIRLNASFNIAKGLVINALGFFDINLFKNKNDVGGFEKSVDTFGEIYAIAMVLTGVDNNISYGGGVDISYTLPSNVLGFNLSYKIFVQGKNLSHQFKAGLNLVF